MLKLGLQSVVGTTERGSWSQAIRWSGARGQTWGLVLKIEHKTEGGVIDLGSVGSSVLTKLREETGEMGRMKQEVEELEEQGFKVAVLAARQEAGKLQIWGRGGVAYLLRENQIVKLWSSETQDETLQGEVVTKDKVMLVVGGNIDELLKQGGGLEAILKEGEGAKELLAAMIYGKQGGNDLAILVGEVREEGEGAQRAGVKMPLIRIKRMSDEPRKFNLILGGVLIGGVVILSVVGGVYKVKKANRVEFETKRSEVTNLLAEARMTVETNPDRARALIGQAKEVIASYRANTRQEQYRVAAGKLGEQIESEEQTLLRVSGAQLITTMELSVLEEDLRAEHMETDGEGNAYFWNERTAELTGLNLRDKSKLTTRIEDGRKLERFASGKGTMVGVTEEGILRVEKEVQKIVIERDETWGRIGQVGWFGGNIYLLDLGNSEIWKYSALEDGYAERKRWLAKGIVLDLTKVIDWVVDGDIWLLTASGKLERYSRGAPIKFELIGFPAEGEAGRFAEPAAVAIGEDKVYVLERGAGRVVTFETSGKYLGQQVDEEFKRASDLVVYGGKGYVLVENVIREFEL